MSNVVPFPRRISPAIEEAGIDLLTAVDVAIRDLRDISLACSASVREQAHECRLMLERALHEALREE